MVEAAVLNKGATAETRAGAGSEAQTDRPLRILVFTLKRQGISPGQRFRIEQWAPHLFSRHGIRMEFVPFESPRLSELLYKPGHKLQKGFLVLAAFLRRARAVLRARRYDGVLVFREASLIGPALYERLLAWSGIPLFFDFDDAIWLSQTSGVNGVFSRLHFFGKASTICRLSTGVFAGNAYLADYARRRNDNVFVIPTTVELSKYPVQQEPVADEPFVICWTGSTSTLANFEYARNALERLAKQRKLRVKVICNQPPKEPIAGAENQFVAWSEENEAEEIGSCHVGIMPLPDDPFTRGKCGLKAIQFMATGRPVVISPVGMNKDLVRHGENGFLAENDEEWIACLSRLADSPELRRQMGSAARKTVEDHYSAEPTAAKLAEALRASLG